MTKIHEAEPSAYRLVRRFHSPPLYPDCYSGERGDYAYILQARLRWRIGPQPDYEWEGEDWVDLPTVVE